MGIVEARGDEIRAEEIDANLDATLPVNECACQVHVAVLGMLRA